MKIIKQSAVAFFDKMYRPVEAAAPFSCAGCAFETQLKKCRQFSEFVSADCFKFDEVPIIWEVFNENVQSVRF